MVALRVDGVDVGRTTQPGFEQADQFTAAQVAGDIPFRTQHNAVAGQRPVDGDLAVVGAERAADLDHGLLLAVRELPVVEGGVVFADDDAGMRLQIARRGGAAICRQVCGSGAKQAAVDGDFAGEDAGIGRCAKADADVHGVFGQIERAVGELEDDFDLGPGLGEFGNQRCQMPAAEAESGVDAEQATRRFPAGRK